MQYLVRKHRLTTSRTCPSLACKHVAPHTLRHSTAMELLHHGVNQSVIALWLGHESRRKKHSLRSPARKRIRADIVQATNYSPSWSRSDYAELPHGRNQAHKLPNSAMRHNPGYGIMPSLMVLQAFLASQRSSALANSRRSPSL
ncbi:tyrosine-type recombinase/integrase [Litchfieldella rifensis]|uniref:Tyrosine-type recombinase/integrase n=1 Tax=Litchfieldella rifensis TaxID=762643 RepID=A0ABV7LIR9_9GAMM